MRRIHWLIIAGLLIGLGGLASAKMEDAAGAGSVLQAQRQSKLDQLYEKGRQLYEAGDLQGAHDTFEEMLAINPDEERAKTYLDNMREEWERFQTKQRGQQEAQEKEKKGQEQLATLISIETMQPRTLSDFVNLLSVPSGISFNIGAGVEATIEKVKFIDVPLSEVLDTTLLPIGLQWQLAGGVVQITPKLETRTFRVSSDKLAKVKALYEDQVLQKLLWGDTATPQLQGESLFIDERNLTVMATDSAQRLNKLNALLSDLERAIAPDLVTRFYRIQPGAGPKVKALVDAVVHTELATPYDLERRVYVDGPDMIVRDSPERVVKIEELLRNQNLLEKIVSGKLEIAVYSLIPRDALTQNVEMLRSFAEQVIEQIQTYLYTKTGMAEAAKEGRKMWYDPNTLTLVITDTPQQVTAVRHFLETLPQLKPAMPFEVIYLKYALSDSLRDQLQQVLGLAPAEGAAGAAAGLQTTANLRRDEEFKWRDLDITLRRVTRGGDLTDDKSDTCELTVMTSGGRTANTMTLNELDVPQFIQDNQGGEYSIRAEDIRPTPNTTNDGRVRLTIKYTPAQTAM